MWWGEHLSCGGVSILLYDVFPAEKHGRTNYGLKKGTLCVLWFVVCAMCVDPLQMCARRRHCAKTAPCSQRTLQKLRLPVAKKRVQRHASVVAL